MRAWREEGRFRARITTCQDITSDAEPEIRVVAGDPAEVRRRLADWLGDFEQADDDGLTTGPAPPRPPTGDR